MGAIGKCGRDYLGRYGDRVLILADEPAGDLQDLICGGCERSFVQAAGEEIELGGFSAGVDVDEELGTPSVEVAESGFIELEGRKDGVGAGQNFAVEGIEVDPALFVDEAFGRVGLRMAEDIGGGNDGFVAGAEGLKGFVRVGYVDGESRELNRWSGRLVAGLRRAHGGTEYGKRQERGGTADVVQKIAHGVDFNYRSEVFSGAEATPGALLRDGLC